MNIQDVQEGIDKVKHYVDDGDDEYAHQEEDGLYIRVLKAIADKKCKNPSACAKLALTVKELDFHRWCA